MRPVCQKWTSELGEDEFVDVRGAGECIGRTQGDLPTNSITSHVNNTFVRLRVQLWRLAHEDLMVFVCEEGRVRLWGLESGHTAMLTWSVW
jgi:hypothetical protein